MIEPPRPTDLATASGRIWDEAASPAAARLARRFEEDWRRSPADGRPDPASYLPDDPTERPGAWLALLRADMGLRWDAGEPRPVEVYRERYPDLDEQTLVALLYEEYCLIEEGGSAPDPAEFERRFPELAGPLRRVLAIHGLIGGPHSTTLGSLDGTRSLVPTPETSRGRSAAASAGGVEFPEAGETIGGFRLIEELGRGSFARVYLAHERLLADRPVALKVATAGSREPQTLARLQHTHIVPVHSYRVDPVSGLHLLCMPFFGRTTLADVLADPATGAARSGAELLEVLDRLEPPEDGPARPETAARAALAGRSFSGAIAWWGARLAEALQHAHDRGVLHRDVKPSNVLVTGDGLPMLLDFNLAMGPVLEGAGAEEESAKLGGTLAYMAPEHIEALADGVDAGVDARADVFALGVVLFEAIAGRRPFPVVRTARSVAEALLRTAERRRAGAPPLSRGGRPISPALEAVIRRSLEADPARRYRSAAELAADLQAVAEDGPLRHASEPIVSRTIRWIRRKRLRFAVAAPAVAAVALLVATRQEAELRRVEVQGEVVRSIAQADLHRQAGNFEAAVQGYDFAMQAASKHPSLAKLWWEAQEKRLWAIHIQTLERHALEFFEQAEWLRYRLFGFVEPERPPGEALRSLLEEFRVFERLDWADEPDFDRLRPEHRRRLLEEIPQLLFLKAVHLWLSGPGGAATAAEVAELRDRAVRAMPRDDPRRPAWDALCRELGIDREAVAPSPRAVAEGSAGRARHAAEAAFLWGIASAARYQGTGDPEDASRAIAWLDAAARGRPDAYWPRFYLASFALEAGRIGEALRHADAAVALNPATPWALFNRALAARASGDSAAALRDLRAASARIPAGDRDQLRERIELNLGVVLLERGDREGARRAFEAIVAAPAGAALGRLGGGLLGVASATATGGGTAALGGPAALAGLAAASGSRFERAARLDLARIDADEGRPEAALLTYGELLADEPEHREARLGRAVLLLALGDAPAALRDAEVLIARCRREASEPGAGPGRDDPRRLAELIEFRARCLLALGRYEPALADAAEALALAPSPARARLHLRALLATRPGAALRLDDPSALDLLPGPGLAADLRHAAEALAAPPGAAEPSPVPRILTRAVLRSALGEDREAEDLASEAALIAPDASLPRLVRARVRYRAGDLDGALADLDAALSLRPDDLASLILRGQILGESGRPLDALADLNRAELLGRDDAALHRARALALAALGRPDAALAELTEALERDPQDPRLALLRGRLHLRVGRAERARSDLDHAAFWSADRPELRPLIAVARWALPPSDAAGR